MPRSLGNDEWRENTRSEVDRIGTENENTSELVPLATRGRSDLVETQFDIYYMTPGRERIWVREFVIVAWPNGQQMQNVITLLHPVIN